MFKILDITSSILFNYKPVKVHFWSIYMFSLFYLKTYKILLCTFSFSTSFLGAVASQMVPIGTCWLLKARCKSVGVKALWIMQHASRVSMANVSAHKCHWPSNSLLLPSASPLLQMLSDPNHVYLHKTYKWNFDGNGRSRRAFHLSREKVPVFFGYVKHTL